MQAERLDLVEHPVERALVRENSAQESVLTLSVRRQGRERLRSVGPSGPRTRISKRCAG